MSKTHWTNLQGISALAPRLQPLSKNSFRAALSTLLLANAQTHSAQRTDPQTAFIESTCTSFPFPMCYFNKTKLQSCALGKRLAAICCSGPSDLCHRSLWSLTHSLCRAVEPGPHASCFSIPSLAPHTSIEGCRSLSPTPWNHMPAPTAICQPAGAGAPCSKRGHGCTAVRQHVCVCALIGHSRALLGRCSKRSSRALLSTPAWKLGGEGAMIRDLVQETLTSTAWLHAWRLNHRRTSSSM